MGKHVITLFLGCVIFMFACCNEDTISPILHQAEALMEASPDSALALLDSILFPEKHSKEDYATWCLLITEARDKNYVGTMSDSVIDVAVRYFEKQNNPNRYAASLYYKGRISEDRQEIEEATALYLKARDAVGENSDNRLLFLIYSRLGRTYIYRDMVSDALAAYQKAYTSAALDADSSSMSYACSYLGRVYGLQKDWQQAISSYSQAIEVAQQVADPTALWLALSELASVYIRNNQLDKASVCLNKVQSVTQPDRQTDMAKIYLTFGDMFRHANQYDSAVVYLNKALQTDDLYTLESAYQCLYYLFEEQKKYEKAIAYNNLYAAYADSVQQQATNIAVLEVQAKYEQEKLVNAYNLLHWEKKQSIYIGLLILLVLLFCLLYAVKYYKLRLRKKEELLCFAERNRVDLQAQIDDNIDVFNQNQKEIGRLTESLANKDDNFQIADAKIRTLEGHNVHLKKNNENLKAQMSGVLTDLTKQKEIASMYKKREEEREACPNIFVRIRNAPRYLSQEDWDEIMVMMDILYGNFTKRLVKKHPNLTKEDLKYCCLFKCMYSHSEIGTFLNVQPETVTRRIQRMKPALGSIITTSEMATQYIKDF